MAFVPLYQNNTNSTPSAGGGFQPLGTPPAAPPEPSLGSKLVGDVKDTVGALGQRYNDAAQAEKESISGQTSAPEAGARIFGSVLGAGNDIIGGGVKAGLQTANAATGGAAGRATGATLQKLAQTPLGAIGINAIHQGSEKWDAFKAKYPRAAQDLSVVPEIANMLGNFVGAGAAKEGVEIAAPLVKKGLEEGASAAKNTVTATKEAAKATLDKTKPTFQQVYTQHALGNKSLSTALDAGTITRKTGEKVTPLDTIEKYQATPKVVGTGKGGHVLDTKAVQAEATVGTKAASKEVDSEAAAIKTPFIKQELVRTALRAAGRDKELTRTASVPAVKSQIQKIFADYGIRGSNIPATKINELRKGANSASQAYYSAQKAAATAGSIPKDVADRAQAFAILGDVFRSALVKANPKIEDALTTHRIHSAALQYAKKAHLSSVGLSGGKRAAVDAGAAGIGAIVGGTVGQPIAGALAGGALGEKGQAILLKRAYEGALKSPKTP